MDLLVLDPFLKVRLSPDFGPKSPDFDFLTKTGLFQTRLSPDFIPSDQEAAGVKHEAIVVFVDNSLRLTTRV